MKLAFYKGKGGWADWIIRIATRSKYSHVEFVLDEGQCFSSSFRDGGVRVKRIDFKPEHWDFIEVEANMVWVFDVFQRTNGKAYDLLGVLFSQGLHISLNSTDKWFCSELVAYLLDLEEPFKYSPGRLYKRVSGS